MAKLTQPELPWGLLRLGKEEGYSRSAWDGARAGCSGCRDRPSRPAPPHPSPGTNSLGKCGVCSGKRSDYGLRKMRLNWKQGWGGVREGSCKEACRGTTRRACRGDRGWGQGSRGPEAL